MIIFTVPAATASMIAGDQMTRNSFFAMRILRKTKTERLGDRLLTTMLKARPARLIRPTFDEGHGLIRENSNSIGEGLLSGDRQDIELCVPRTHKRASIGVLKREDGGEIALVRSPPSGGRRGHGIPDDQARRNLRGC
jgi:hypothetical protein